MKHDDVLGDVRVIDITTMMSGPYCTRLMADLGAEVIKIESPDGDHIRTRPPLQSGRSTYFGQLNAGKKSLSLDLKKTEARELVIRLVEKSHIFVENARPGVMDRLGLGYEQLRVVNPRLVYCSISGYGQTGTWSRRSAYAPVLHAASGFDLAALNYHGESDRPMKNGIFVGDVLGGALAFGAIQAALRRADRTGQGEYVDVSLFESMLGLLVYETQEAQFPAEHKRPLYQPTRASDGYILIAPTSQANFIALTIATGRPEWASDERFSTITARADNWSTLMGFIEEWAASRTSAECERLLTEAGVPCSRYFTVAEALDLPPAAEREVLQPIADRFGNFKVTNPAFRFAHSRAYAREHVAELGRDASAVLADVLGMSPAEIRALHQTGALHHAGDDVRDVVQLSPDTESRQTRGNNGAT